MSNYALIMTAGSATSCIYYPMSNSALIMTAGSVTICIILP